MIVPTVGRKVWYRPSKHDLIGLGAMVVQKDRPLDATVLAVWGDRLINVQVLDIMGKPFTKTSVTLIQEGDMTPKDVDGNEVYGWVQWMPYQAVQAKKEEDKKPDA